MKINFVSTSVMIFFCAILFVAYRVSIKTNSVKEIHVSLAEIDREHAIHIMEYRMYSLDRIRPVDGVVPANKILEAEFLYEQSKFDFKKSELLLKLTKETGEYYGLGRKMVP